MRCVFEDSDQSTLRMMEVWVSEVEACDSRA